MSKNPSYMIADPPDHPIWDEMAKVAKLEQELSALKSLVREMGEFIQSTHDISMGLIRVRAAAILSRPEVKALLTGESHGE